MSHRIDSLKIKAKLLQKSKKKAGKSIKLKDAYEIIARSSGYKSWRDLKSTVDQTPSFLPPKNGPSLRHWFSDHAEALRFAESNGGFVVPYEKDFFIADQDFLRSLGISSDDEDLLQVGNDWSNPKSLAAYQRMLRRIEKSR